MQQIGPDPCCTRLHSGLDDQIRARRAAGRTDLRSEVSFKDQERVGRGAKGSIRVDVIQYDRSGKPVAIWDLKTGGAKLTQARIKQIRAQLPKDLKQVPIYEFRPRSRGYSSPGPK